MNWLVSNSFVVVSKSHTSLNQNFQCLVRSYQSSPRYRHPKSHSVNIVYHHIGVEYESRDRERNLPGANVNLCIQCQSQVSGMVKIMCSGSADDFSTSISLTSTHKVCTPCFQGVPERECAICPPVRSNLPHGVQSGLGLMTLKKVYT